MRPLLFSLLLVFTISGCVSGNTPEITHTFVQQTGDIEIRQYAPTVAATITVETSRDDAPNKGFRPLFDYISGNNTAAQEIPMTTPVSQTAQAKTSQKIPMTTPVSQQQTANGQWEIAFYMPPGMTLEQTPKPKDPRVSIKAVPEKRVAAIVFSGMGSDASLTEHEEKLRRYLEENEIAFVDTPMYAFYDPPLVPWFMRRNEVLFELE